ncbi:MAG: hypothetical protein HKN82_07610 [Akkermansiaceae bacterium]|nr:hypothetical protein [Akkermansiaceae bacterium]NNM28537.1 hypothetical protein [Akkermansiaceae bacterium]
MEFYEPKKKDMSVPIIPLIDILAILLIFFIISTTFKKPRPILTIDLPTVKEVFTEEVTDERAVLAVAADGRVTLDIHEVPEGTLAAYLMQFKTDNPNRELELEADQAVSIRQLFEIWDALTEADIEIKDVPARIRVPAESPGKEETE